MESMILNASWSTLHYKAFCNKVDKDARDNYNFEFIYAFDHDNLGPNRMLSSCVEPGMSDLKKWGKQ